MDLFSLRLNCLDHYQSSPTDLDPRLLRGRDQYNNGQAPKVPVIRAFGATPTGQKVCAHIHGAFPYLYIEYQEGLEPEQVDAYVHRLHLSIDHALGVSYRRDLSHGSVAFVAHITLVKGIPFYGYHVGYRYFLKIYLLNPLHITRLADLLRQAAVMKTAIQPYESHMQYIPQWMCDYNLYGCQMMDCSRVRFRTPVPSAADARDVGHAWHDGIVFKEALLDDLQYPRQSHCAIEVDICVQDIVNRLELKARPLHDVVNEESRTGGMLDQKLVHSMAGLWKDETRRRKTRMGLSDPNSSPFPPEVLVSVSADPRNQEPGGWIHEDEYRQRLIELASDERQQHFGGDRPAAAQFEASTPKHLFIKTAFESVEDLYPSNLPHLNPMPLVNGERSRQALQELPLDVDVDETRILSLEEEDYGAGQSDDEALRDLQISQHKAALENIRNTTSSVPKPTTRRKALKQSTPEQADFETTAVKAPSSEEAKETTSSSEMRRLGLRKPGKYDRLEDEDFDIPPEFLVDMSSASHRYFRADGRHMAPERASKRRKILPPTPKAPQRVIKGLNQRLPLCNGGSHVPSHTAREPSPPSAPSYNPRMPRPNRQNGKLDFVTVKDPHDPATILRLSQQSQASDKGTRSDDSIPRKKSSGPSSQQDDYAQPPEEPASRDESTASARFQTTDNVDSVCHAFNIQAAWTMRVFDQAAPAPSLVAKTLSEFGLPSAIHQDAYYSREADVPERLREYAGKAFRLESLTVPFLPDFGPMALAENKADAPDTIAKYASSAQMQQAQRSCTLRMWEIARPPPLRRDVQAWVDEHDRASKSASESRTSSQREGESQIIAPTQQRKHGFKYSQKQAKTSVRFEIQYMSLMSLEVHVNTRGSFVPNPEFDEIASIFWCLQLDDDASGTRPLHERYRRGVAILAEDENLAIDTQRQTQAEVHYETTELDLINRIVDLVRELDPDVLTGFEVHNSSWGYVIERARMKYEYDLCDELSRMKSQSHGRFGREADRWGFNQTSTIRVTGRHMINIWRAMRSELNLLQYTLENIVYHVLHRRVPHYTFADLTSWYRGSKPSYRARVMDYYLSRTQLDIEILEQNELIPRTSEQARLLGVDFFSVFSRGSQFKVESLMFRIAKPENLILISPSRKQVGQQNALECLPLVMEPQSAFYPSPLLVLDFQSLYPSVMIAYNYCYSTFLGRITNWRGQNKMGFTDFDRQPGLLDLLRDHINIAPNGMMYARPNIRKSLLAKMLGELLETRVMVKSGMKADKEDKNLQRLLNNRQLALKFVANVTYGYTSASFSGRMPCSEIADSIVQTGRETLEKAIALIHSVERWGAEVVYGDTDSLFVYLKGRSRDQAFDIGNEIAQAITDMNPRPVKLKFEKVYHPCVLLAKKRYVGYKYESKTQTVPEFDAKGIETVRRDGTPAEQKIEEKVLKMLFETADLSQIKRYVQAQCRKIMKGKVSIQDFCFAKEVKLGTYSDRGPPPPGALISTRRMLEDPRTEPQYGERVPYVVVTGAPGARLIDRCVAPEELLQNEESELDAEYYISKNIIPPLERIFNLMGANVRQWYDEMPKYHRIRPLEGATSMLNGRDAALPTKKTLESYLKSSACIVCCRRIEADFPICDACQQQPAQSLAMLRQRLRVEEKRLAATQQVCRSCAGVPFEDSVRCDSKDCPVFYARAKQTSRHRATRALVMPALQHLEYSPAALEW